MAADTTVHFFGDSFVAGFGDPGGRGWVGRVAERAAADGRSFRAVNHGVPGATSAETVARWLRATDDPRNAGLADTKVVFSFGTNDVIVGMNAEESLAALRAALERAAAIDVPAFVIGPPPVGDLPAADARLRELSSRFAAACGVQNVEFVPTHAELAGEARWTGETAAGDGSHPQSGGYTALAELLIEGGLIDWISD
ncbi:MAG: GDSL-type esterase/lipase family protein [Solirubrobacterales bacterium]